MAAPKGNDFGGNTFMPKDEDGNTYMKAVFAKCYATAMIENGFRRPNARLCAIAAGSKKSAASTLASLWLKDESVQRAIQRHMDDHMAVFDITAERIMREIAMMAFSNMADYLTPSPDGSFFVNWSDLTREQAAALAEVTVDEYVEGKGENAQRVKKVRFKLADKSKNLELLGRWRKLFTDKTELSGPDGAPLPPSELHVHFMESDGDGKPKSDTPQSS